MKTAFIIASVAMGVASVGVTGCDRNSSTSSTPPNSGSGITKAEPGAYLGPDLSGPSSPGGPPAFGSPTGTGFPTGNAAQSDGQGSGLMGWHETGQAGTSGAITDTSNRTSADPAIPSVSQGHSTE